MAEVVRPGLIEQFAQINAEKLRANPYPGRGIVMGINQEGTQAIQVYWVMGRSQNSRNRVLVEEKGVIKTKPFIEDPGQDTSLIIYTAMREVNGVHVVSNGAQTDAVADALAHGGAPEDALAEWAYEPDAPNFTPRITGVLDVKNLASSRLSLIKKAAQTDETVRSTHYTRVEPGIGNMVTTYKGDGNPLPSFDTNPLHVPLRGSVEEIGVDYWGMLNPENRVALAVKGIDLSSGQSQVVIFNALEQ